MGCGHLPCKHWPTFWIQMMSRNAHLKSYRKPPIHIRVEKSGPSPTLLPLRGTPGSFLVLSMSAFLTVSTLPVRANRRRLPKRALATPGFRAPTAKLSAILFDCDGVLAESERDGHRAAFNAAFEALGLPDRWDSERYGVLLNVGGGKERLAAHWNEMEWPASCGDAVARDELVRAVHKKKTVLFSQLVTDGKVPLREGVRQLFAEAVERGVKVAVCSTSQEPAVRGVVAQLGKQLADQVPIFAGDVVPRKKPAPDVYLLALRELGLRVDETCVVEDSAIGVAAAKAAGLSVLVTKSAYTQNEDFSHADRVVTSIADAGITVVDLEAVVDKTAATSDDGAT